MQQSTAPVVAAPAGPADDLLCIRGIDAPIAAALNRAGLTRFGQIAKWVKSDIEKVTSAFGFKPGRIEQENWIEQAQILAGGNETAYARQRRLGSAGAQSPMPPPVSASASGALAAAAAAAAAAGNAMRPAGPHSVSITNMSPQVAERAAFATPPPTAATSPAASQQQGIAPASPIRPSATPERDNLQRISGISQELARMLNAQGVGRYTQIASWSRDDIVRFDRLFGADGRIARENWIEQAQILSKGGHTAYSRSFDAHLPGAAGGQSDHVATAGASAARVDLSHLPSVRSDAYRPRVDASTAAAAVAAATRGGFRPPRATEVDDLKRIRGIGVLIEKKLNSIGVVSYEQVAQWNTEDIDRVSHMLDFKGRIERENWVEQARILAAGGDTEFSQRVDRGEVETSKKV